MDTTRTPARRRGALRRTVVAAAIVVAAFCSILAFNAPEASAEWNPDCAPIASAGSWKAVTNNCDITVRFYYNCNWDGRGWQIAWVPPGATQWVNCSWGWEGALVWKW